MGIELNFSDMLPLELNSVAYTNNPTLGASMESIRILQKGQTQVNVPVLKYTSLVSSSSSRSQLFQL